jgi:hypothetical protein
MLEGRKDIREVKQRRAGPCSSLSLSDLMGHTDFRTVEIQDFDSLTTIILVRGMDLRTTLFGTLLDNKGLQE